MLANPKTDDGNYHAIWNPTARIYDSVGKSKNLRCKYDVNYHAIRGPAPHFLDSVDRAAGEASLSLEKDATLVPEVSYFTVPFPASSHRLRAPAPYVRQSSTGVQILGGARGALLGMPMCTVIYVTFVILCLTSSIVLRIPTENSQTDREGPQRASGPQGIFDGSSQPEK